MPNNQLYPRVSGNSILVQSDGSTYKLNRFLELLNEAIGPDVCLGSLAQSLGIIPKNQSTLKTYMTVGNLPEGTDVFNAKPIEVLQEIYTENE